jgi:hypothetical protein
MRGEGGGGRGWGVGGGGGVLWEIWNCLSSKLKLLRRAMKGVYGQKKRASRNHILNKENHMYPNIQQFLKGSVS